MGFFKSRKAKKEEVRIQDQALAAASAPASDNDEISPEIIAVITAAVCAAGQYAGAGSLVVRSIVRGPDQGTAWNRLQLSNRAPDIR